MRKVLIVMLLFFGNLCKSENRPFLFIENKGQWSKEIKFLTEIPHGWLLIQENGLKYVFSKDTKHAHGESHHQLSAPKTQTLFVEFLNQSDLMTPIGMGKQKTKFNYYQGSDPTKYGEACSVYKKVVLRNVYAGVHMELYAMSGNLKYDLIIEQNANISNVKLSYHGSHQMYLEDGCSFIDMGDFTIMENRPFAYQLDTEGEKNEVECHFQMDGDQVSFKMGDSFDPLKKVVIDPELIFSTFSGAVSDNFGYTACFDTLGNLYSGGIVFGADFQSTTYAPYGGNIDVAILKYDSTGTDLLYGTFIGGGEQEFPHSLVVNNQNELLIMGTTGSLNFPVSLSAYDTSYNGGSAFSIFGSYPNGSDLFVTKLDETGLLLASTLIGSPGNDGVLKMRALRNYQNELIYNYGDFQRGDINVDDEDNVFVVSSTDHQDFPTTGEIQTEYGGGNSDAILFSFSNDLSTLRWSTFLGGSGDDAGYSIKIDRSQNVVVGGGTTSSDFKTTENVENEMYLGDVDGFIARLNVEQDTILSSTFLGTDTYDQVYFIDLDSEDNILAFGQTAGVYPTTDGVYKNPNSSQFIHKFTPDLTTVFSTVFGSGTSSPNISPTAFLVNDCDNIYLSGWGGTVNNRNGNLRFGDSWTYGMPVTDDAFMSTTDSSDFYLMVLSSDASELLYATYFGSTNNGGDHVDGGTSRFDKQGIIYQSVCSCGGSDDDFPTTPSAWSEINRGINSDGDERCNNAAFKFDLASLKARFDAIDPSLDEIISVGCAPLTLEFVNKSIGGEVFEWEFSDGFTASDPVGLMYTFETPGTYTVSLTATNKKTCRNSDTITKTITVYGDEINVSGGRSICLGERTQIWANGAISYDWSPGVGLSDSTISNPIAAPQTTTEYQVTAISINGCKSRKKVLVEVIEPIFENFDVDTIYSCENVTYTFINKTQFDGPIIWELSDGTTSTDSIFTHQFMEEGRYDISLNIPDQPCVVDKRFSIDHKNNFIPNVFTPNNDSYNPFFKIQTISDRIALTLFDRTGKLIFSSDDYQNDWDGKNHPAGVYYYHLEFPNESKCKGWVHIFK